MLCVYQSKITYKGIFADKFLAEGIMLIFPDSSEVLEIKEYSFLVNSETLPEEILPGYFLTLNDEAFYISHVGEIALKNLIELGHITIKFGKPATSVMPGSIYLESDQIPEVRTGTLLRILKAPSKS